MFDDSLMSLLPDAYEGLEIVTATSGKDCTTGWYNSIIYCKPGQCANA
jgi:hypothetical protein